MARRTELGESEFDTAETKDGVEVVNGTVELVFPETVPDSGVAKWDMEDDSDTTTATDVWGSHDASINGATYTTDAEEGDSALEFGAGDSVSRAEMAEITVSSDFSISAWFKAYSIGEGSGGGIVAQYNGSNDRVGMTLDSDSTALVCNVYDGSFTGQSTTSYSFDVWHHVVMTHDAGAGAVTAYLDGNSFTGSDTQGVGSSDNFSIGYRPNDNSFDGILDDVRIYDKVLSDTEVQDLYETGSI